MPGATALIRMLYWLSSYTKARVRDTIAIPCPIPDAPPNTTHTVGDRLLVDHAAESIDGVMGEKLDPGGCAPQPLSVNLTIVPQAVSYQQVGGGLSGSGP
jgi:hypothetical protein